MKKKFMISLTFLIAMFALFVFAGSPSYTVNTPSNGTYLNGANDGNYTINITSSVSSNITVSIMNASNGLNISHFTSDLNTTHIIIWNITNGTFPEGTYNITIVGFNQTNTSEITSIVNAANNITIDTTNASISSLASSSEEESAVITWSTNEDTNSSLAYGPAISGLSGYVGDEVHTLNHIVSLSGLIPSTIYYVNVTSCDRAGNCNTTGPINFTTLTGAAGTGGSSSSGSSGGNSDSETFAVEDMFVEEQSLFTGNGFDFKVGGSSHSVELTSIDYDAMHVVLTVSSDPQEFIVEEGKSVAVDVNMDGYNDLKITVVDILSAAKAIIKYEGLVVVEEPVVEEPVREDIIEEEQPKMIQESPNTGANYTFWWVLLGIVILALAIYFIKKNKK